MHYFVGRPFPLGSHFTQYNDKHGVNFALFSQHATAVELAVFIENREQRFPMVKSDDIWHVFVEGIAEGTQYGYRVYGEADESKGHLFNPQKLLIDPYAYQIIGQPNLATLTDRQWFQWNDTRDNAHLAPKAVVLDHQFDWQGDARLFIPWAKTIIYETHVKGFSKLNPDVPKEIAGTFAGMAHPASITHLKRLGITAVELQPISYHIDEPHLQALGLKNYWGYNVLGHFALDPTLAKDQTNPLNEFKHMVRTLHQAGIEVILDVVFNHTAEAGKDGPMLCQRGIDNPSYYWLNEDKDYFNWSGCGNTLNVSNHAVLRWVIDCLCYWVTECHVDGFRFDLGAILGRSPTFSEHSAFFTAITSNSTLNQVKLIAEPWDIGWHGYQLGTFPKPFAEWNDRYRDEIKRFFLTQHGDLAKFVRHFAGSDDLFAHNRLPASSINYITAHDGFTLQDLVSYNDKHNWANGEDNRDGHHNNISNNHGIEGKTSDVGIIEKRNATRKALLATLLLSGGTPMLLGGDEMGNSQQGNNNSYCQDNETTWLDWQNADQDLINYIAKLIDIRKQIPLLSKYNQWWATDTVQWLHPFGEPIQFHDWHDESIKSIQILLENQWLILINAKQNSQRFLLPKGNWDTLLGVENSALTTDTLAVTLDTIGVCVLQRKNK